MTNELFLFQKKIIKHELHNMAEQLTIVIQKTINTAMSLSKKGNFSKSEFIPECKIMIIECNHFKRRHQKTQNPAN